MWRFLCETVTIIIVLAIGIFIGIGMGWSFREQAMTPAQRAFIRTTDEAEMRTMQMKRIFDNKK